MGWIGVDLDGTLSEYDGLCSAFHIGKPIKPMVNFVKRMLSDGLDVRIFTARVYFLEPPEGYYHPYVDEYRDIPKIRLTIEKWCERS